MSETIPAEVDYPDTPFPLAPGLILLGRRGSEAHGTYVPPTDPHGIDDRDLLGVVVPPRPYYCGMKKWEGADSIKGPWDVVLYEARKFVRLLVQQNPNTLCMLWLAPEDVVFASAEGRVLIDARHLFRGKRAAKDSFVGYAHGQLKRMTHFEFNGYMGAKRKALVEKHGFDTKNAAHLVRIMRMGLEYLRTGTLTVRRPDAAELVAIKRGEWSLTQVRDEAGRLFAQVDEAFATSPMPDEVDEAAVGELLERIVWGRLTAADTAREGRRGWTSEWPPPGFYWFDSNGYSLQPVEVDNRRVHLPGISDGLWRKDMTADWRFMPIEAPADPLTRPEAPGVKK